MADDDDHTFEKAEAGASATYPMQVLELFVFLAMQTAKIGWLFHDGNPKAMAQNLRIIDEGEHVVGIRSRTAYFMIFMVRPVRSVRALI